MSLNCLGRRLLAAAVGLVCSNSPALAEMPRSKPDSVPPGLVTIHDPAGGVHSTVGEVPAWDGLPESLDNPGMMDRFYVHAYRFAQDSNLHAAAMPEIWYGTGNSFMYDQQYRYNAPQLESIVKSALGRAAIEEVLHHRTAEGEESWLLQPVTQNEQIARRLRPGFDGSISLRTTGVGAAVTYNVGNLSIGTGYQTEVGQLQPVRVSYPFLDEDTRGEFGIDSNGSAWLILNSRW